MVSPAPLAPLEVTWESLVLGGGVEALFADPGLPLEVEIGPGDDDLLVQQALAHPERNWLGIEYSHKRVQRLVRRVRRMYGEPGNLRLIWRPAADLIGPFLSPARVEAYHIYFPDPWPKAHHARYRLVTPEFARTLAESLVPGGAAHLVTDSEPYALEMAEALAGAGLVSRIPPPGYAERTPGAHLTVFEQRWREMGRRILRLEFRRPLE